MSEPIRVLQVLGVLNRGGAESMIMNLYRKVDKAQVQFDFVVHTEKECAFDDEVRALGGRIFAAPRYNGKNHFSYEKWWRKFFSEHPEYKVVHGHIYTTASIYLKIAKSFGCITIAHSHSTSYSKGIRGIAERITQRPLRNIAHWLFSCSNLAGWWLYGKGCEKRCNYMVLNNAIDTEKYYLSDEEVRTVREELGLGSAFVVGHLGRFSYPKNHEFLVDIFEKVKNFVPDAKLLLIGGGEKQQEIEEKVKALGLEKNVVFTGVRADVERMLSAMDCFVFPSRYEGLPVSVVEAQAAGLPCFISDRITEEVCLTNAVKRLSIDESAEVWCEKILEKRDSFARKDMKQEIVDSGFDINTTSRWLTEFYIKENGKAKR